MNVFVKVVEPECGTKVIVFVRVMWAEHSVQAGSGEGAAVMAGWDARPVPVVGVGAGRARARGRMAMRNLAMVSAEGE